MIDEAGDLPAWLLRRVADSGWGPFLAGAGLLVVRRLTKALLPDGYYFKAMDRLLKRRNNGKD